MPLWIIPILGRILPILGILLALWYGWHKLDNYCNAACDDQRIRADTAESAIKSAQQRATDLAILYADTLEKVDAALKVAETERQNTFNALRDRATRAGANRSVVVSGESHRLLRDAADSANGSEAAPAAGIGEERAPVPEAAYSEADLNTFIVDAAAAYRAVNEARLACIALYEGTQ